MKSSKPASLPPGTLSAEWQAEAAAAFGGYVPDASGEAQLTSPLRGEVGPQDRVRGSKASPASVARARILRRKETDAERRLWAVLRNRQLEGHKFVRQYPIGNYIADFARREAMLVIEVDGSQHADSPTDARRTAYLKASGYFVLRIWNNDISHNLQGVAEAILATINDGPSPGQRFAPATLSPEGRGEAGTLPQITKRRKK